MVLKVTQVSNRERGLRDGERRKKKKEKCLSHSCGWSQHIGKAGPYGPTMSVCTNVMSKGVHNIVFSVMPDM